MKKYFTGNEVSMLLGIASSTIYNYIKSGKLKANKVMKKTQFVYQIEKTDIENFLGYPIEISIEYSETLKKELFRIKESCIPKKTPEELERLKREFAEIYENIMRYKLHFLDRGELLRKGKVIYEKLYSETKQRMLKENPYVDVYGKLIPFTLNAAEKLNLSMRTIEQDIYTAKNLIPEVKKLVRERNINIEETLRLARKSPEEQLKIIEKIDEKDKETIKSLKNSIRLGIRRDLYEKAKKFTDKQDVKTVSKLMDILLETYIKGREREVSSEAPGQDKPQMISLNEIIIPNSYLRLSLSENKIQKIIDFYKEHGRLDKPITVFRETILTDGYKRYVAALELGLTEVPVKFASTKIEPGLFEGPGKNPPPVSLPGKKKIKKKKSPVPKKTRTTIPLIASNLKGRIKRVVPGQGYGFINGENGETYFFHHKGLKGITIDDLEEWYCVTFDVTEGRKGLQAINIQQYLNV